MGCSFISGIQHAAGSIVSNPLTAAAIGAGLGILTGGASLGLSGALAGAGGGALAGGTAGLLVGSTLAQHQAASDAADAQAKALGVQTSQGEAALQAQKDALAQQKAASDAALAEQQKADQARIDQANAALGVQKDQFNSTLAASTLQAQQQLQAQRDAATLQTNLAKDAAEQQKTAMQAQIAAANRLYAQQSEQINRANQKQPDTAAITSANQQQGKSGQSGTMLTGAAGVDLSQLLLGKNTLLGG